MAYAASARHNQSRSPGESRDPPLQWLDCRPSGSRLSLSPGLRVGCALCVLSNGLRERQKVPLRALKILVVVMGIMLVVGFAALVAVIAGRLSQGPANLPSAPGAAVPLELPAGARIETIGVGADRLVLAVLRSDGTRELIVVDIASRRRLAAIPLQTTQ